MVDLEKPDFERFPRFGAATAVEAVSVLYDIVMCTLVLLFTYHSYQVLFPGDALVVPPCWWCHITLAGGGENISINFQFATQSMASLATSATGPPRQLAAVVAYRCADCNKYASR